MFSATNYPFSSTRVYPYEDIVTVEHGRNYTTDNYYQYPERNRRRRYSPTFIFFCILCGLCLIGTIIAAILLGVLLRPNSTASTTATVITGTTISATTTTTTATTAITTTTAITISTASTDSTITTDILCSPACTPEQKCVLGTCVGTGRLSLTLTWSRPGDGDIVVATPDNNFIHYSNRGPWLNTSQGELDVDDRNGTGPENVFWSSSSILPPTGTYYVCFSQYNLLLNASITNPVTATVNIEHPPATSLTFTKTFTFPYEDYDNCDSTSIHLLGSFTYP